MFVSSQMWENSPINEGAGLVVFHEKYCEPKQPKIRSAIAWLAWLVELGQAPGRSDGEGLPTVAQRQAFWCQYLLLIHRFTHH